MPLSSRPLLVASLFSGLVLSSLVAAPAVTGARSGKWAHEGATLKPDEHVIWGRLDNGLRYALRPHTGVPGRVAMKLIVLTGSVDERDDEQGIAHFTEHMAFHGSAEMAEAEMVSFFRRLGAEYGSDVNAMTTFDSTVYSLDFRVNESKLLADGFRLFKGIAGSIRFDPAAIESERRVIFAEKRNRSGLADQQLLSTFPVFFRGTAFAHHAPIGVDETLRSFRREHFLDFYRRGYRPDLMVVVAAGDFDPAVLETTLRDTFGSLPRPGTPLPIRPEGRPDLRNLRAGVYRIPGIGSASTTAAAVAPLATRLDPREAKLRAQRSAFAMTLFQNRLRLFIPGSNSPQASYETLMNYESVVASVSVPGPAWSQGILGVDQVIRDTLKQGFTPMEVKEFRDRALQSVEQQLGQLPVIDPADLCGLLADSITGHEIFVGPQTEQAWAREWLSRVTPDEINRTFRDLWDIERMAFHVGGDVGLDLNSNEVLKTVQRHRRGELIYNLPPPSQEEHFTLKKPGPPASVAESKPIPGFGGELIRLSNNVRLNFIPTRNEPGLVRAIVRIGDGLLALPGRRPALKEFGLNTLIGSGTVFYQTEQIARIIDQRFLDFSFDIADNDAFTFRGLVTVANLETFLGVTTEIIRRPKFNAYAHRDERIRAAMNRSAGSMGMEEGQRDLMDHLFQGDARFMSGTPLDYVSLSVRDVRQWMEEPLMSGYLEVTLVGDLSREEAVRLVLATLGTLGPRAVDKSRASPPEPVKVTARPGFKRIEFVGELNVATIRGNWPVTAPIDARTNAALQVLSKLLEFRLRAELRENLGYAYAPSANFDPFGGYDNFGLMEATIDCTPVDAQRAAQAVQDTAAALAVGGADAEEFEAGRSIIRNQLRQGFKSNAFLANLFKRVQEKPGRLEEILSLQGGLLEQLNRDEVNGWAAKILTADNARTAMIVPKQFVGIFEGNKL